MNVFFYELGIGTPCIWIFISICVGNGTSKVQTSAKSGVRVQQPPSEIWNSRNDINIDLQKYQYI